MQMWIVGNDWPRCLTLTEIGRTLHVKSKEIYWFLYIYVSMLCAGPTPKDYTQARLHALVNETGIMLVSFPDPTP